VLDVGDHQADDLEHLTDGREMRRREVLDAPQIVEQAHRCPQRR